MVLLIGGNEKVNLRAFENGVVVTRGQREYNIGGMGKVGH